jgi:hypothetical protein
VKFNELPDEPSAQEIAVKTLAAQTDEDLTALLREAEEALLEREGNLPYREFIKAIKWEQRRRASMPLAAREK